MNIIKYRPKCGGGLLGLGDSTLLRHGAMSRLWCHALALDGLGLVAEHEFEKLGVIELVLTREGDPLREGDTNCVGFRCDRKER